MKSQLTIKKHNLRRKVGRVLLALWIAVIPLLSMGLTGLNASVASAQTLQLDPNMDNTWKRTDQFVAQGTAARSWLWGPQAFNIIAEDYDGSPAGGGVPAGKRLVAYYDKSRMEINNPNGDRNNKYFVTNGLLVKELISGKRATSDSKSVPYLPSNIPVVGDSENNSNAPTYASLAGVASLNLGQNTALNRVGSTVSSFIDGSGTAKEDLTYANYKVTNVYYDATFGHNVPKVFWDFMNSQGQVLEGGKSVNGPVVDWLFSTGYPITEAYWSKVNVAGKSKDVLVQCFERRCYSYTPSNPAAFQVEMGNVGRHYYEWRYNTPLENCSSTPVRGFGKLWSENPSVRARISCPYSYSNEQATKVSMLHFEHGTMVWVNSGVDSYYLPYPKTIFVVFDDGSWASVQDKWDTNQPVNDGATPPSSNLHEPKRGFWRAWHDETGLKLRERLGWATEADEVYGDGAAQGFWNGLMIYFKPTKQIFVAYQYYSRTNVWEAYDDTFRD